MAIDRSDSKIDRRYCLPFSLSLSLSLPLSHTHTLSHSLPPSSFYHFSFFYQGISAAIYSRMFYMTAPFSTEMTITGCLISSNSVKKIIFLVPGLTFFSEHGTKIRQLVLISSPHLQSSFPYLSISYSPTRTQTHSPSVLLDNELPEQFTWL